MKKYAIQRIWQHSMETKQPIYIIIDDTVNEKTVPLSKAQRKIQGCFFHHSHLKRKTVYGYQFVTVMLRCGAIVLPYDIILYQKDEMSKIELAQKVLKEFPHPVCKGYVLADSWYSCEALFDALHAIGFQYIGALKSNRKIFPRGFKKVKIIMSWPQNALWNPHALKCFISLDIELSTKQILKHYLNRWPIETFFRETKHLKHVEMKLKSLK